MKKNTVVSIIIPCYNQAQYLNESVQSAINQSYSNIEIIIVNDGSTDNTQDIAEGLQKKYPELIRVVTQENQGLSEARNTGIRESSGRYILPLDADDKLDCAMLTKSIKMMIQNNIDIVSTDTQCFGSKDNKIIPTEFPECTLLYHNCWIVTSLYRRDVWERTGGYKKNMHGGYEDWEFWINAYKHGFKFQRYPETLFYYRTKRESMYISAKDKDEYLKSKIIMNHPELYILPQVQEAINVIKETEGLANLYFYYDENMTDNEKMWITEVSHYIVNNSLKEKQIIEILNHKVGLVTLDILENNTSLAALRKEIGADYILFYSPIRYEVEVLKNSNFAWDKDKGIIESNGTIFSFVFKATRENASSQLIAYKRLLWYKEKYFNKEPLMHAISKVIQLSTITNPIKKYKAYKSMLQIYFTIQKD